MKGWDHCDACKALDCEAAIVQSKLIVDYGELDTRESLPPYILSSPWHDGRQSEDAVLLAPTCAVLDDGRRPKWRCPLRLCCTVARAPGRHFSGHVTPSAESGSSCDIPSLHHRAGSALSLVVIRL